MDDIVCQYKFCSGHGECVHSPVSSNITCACEAGWTGSKCDVAIPPDPEQLTIGQKLLKEPIWIGMIVMLNLVLFFCVSYVARRKCGKKIARLMPKCKKLPENSSKEVSHSKEESSTARDIYSLHIELPRSENSSKSPISKTPTKFLFEKVETSAPPTPTVIGEKAKEAALKLFEAYKSNNPFPIQAENQRLSQSLDASQVIQDGTVSFIERVGYWEKPDTSPPMIRSYTVSSVDHEEASTTKQNWKNLLRQTRSFPGSPRENRKTRANEDKKQSHKVDKSLEVEHCYPVIRILNENNHEQQQNSDSENSVVIDIARNQICDNLKTSVDPNGENPDEYVKTLGSVDSGYPTTTGSTRTTQFGGRYSVHESRSASAISASERRKLFGDKTKSKSFYDISHGDSQYSAETSSFSTDNDTKAIGIRRSMPSDLNNFRSFDSGQYCIMCRRDRNFDHAETYSCESDLNRLHRPQRMYSSDARTKHRSCNCRKCQQRSKSHCRKHIRQFSREIGSLDISHTCRHNSDLNLRRFNQRSRRRSNEKLFYTVGPNRSFQENMKVTHSTSTESDVCDCSRNKTRARRKCYKRTEHYSDDSWKMRHKRPDLASIKTITASWELSKDQSYKRSPVDSYLSNAQFVGHPYEMYNLTVEPRGCIQDLTNDTFRNVDVGADYYQNQPPSLVHSSIQMGDLPEIKTKIRNNSQPPNLTDVEVVSSHLRVEADIIGKSWDKLETVSVEKIETTPQSTSSSDKTNTTFKDSAYQTKQSSVDRYNSIKDRNGIAGSKTNSKQADGGFRNDDKVRRHLHQAAQKLAMLKRLQTAQEQFSKDSAVYTFSEDDLSADDQDPRSLRPLVKRTSGIAFQMKEMNLSEVQEEYSGVSHGSYNTPNNEPATDQPDRHKDEHKTMLPLTNLYRSESGVANYQDIPYLDETKV